MLLQILINEKSLPISLTNKKLSALSCMFFKKTSQKNVILKYFQRAVISYRADVVMSIFACYERPVMILSK